MIWDIFQNIGFSIFLVLSLYFASKHKYVDLLALHFWAVAFACCYKFFITLWTPEKIVDIAIVYCIIFHRPKYRSHSEGVLIKFVIGMFVMLLFSNFFALLFTNKYTYSISPVQRIILQDVSYLIPTVILLFGPFLPKGFAGTLYKKFCVACEFGIIVGLIHLLCNIVGIPFMPILRAQAENNEANSVLAQFGSTLVTRIYGFAGEPKGLGFFLVPYLVSSFAALMMRYYVFGFRHQILFFILGLIVLFFTLSSSALITIIVTLPIVTLIMIRRLSKRTGMVLILSLLLCVCGYLGTTDYENSFFHALNERTFERGIDEMENDRQETIILQSYKNEVPIKKIFGWGIGQYSFNVPGQVLDNMLIPVQSGFVLTLADFGIGGIVMFLCIVLYSVIIAWRAIKKNATVAFFFAAAAISKCVEATIHGSVVLPLLFAMIATYAYSDSVTN